MDIRPTAMSAVLNSFPLQYFPVLTADEQTIIYTTRDGVSLHDDENIVVSDQRCEQGKWQRPIGISPNINSRFNEGTCTISADGRTLIFTNCEGRARVGGAIYTSATKEETTGVSQKIWEKCKFHVLGLSTFSVS
jgi:OOP family OmpA-OmpF porin